MWPVNKPSISAREVLQKCISGKIAPSTKAILESYLPLVEDAENRFDQAVRAGVVHTLTPDMFATGSDEDNELKKVYTDRMAKLNKAGRPIYDKLLSAVRKCPFCGFLQPTELDHYLPKDGYKLISISPLNLTPICKDCNKKKSNIEPHAAEQVFMHPYYNEVAGSQWLAARVIETAPATVHFFVKSPDSWSGLLASRVDYHFRFFEIDRLYGCQAADEMSGIRALLDDQYTTVGKAAVRDHLAAMARSRSRPAPNRWDAALYEALARSDWYCKEGYNLT